MKRDLTFHYWEPDPLSKLLGASASSPGPLFTPPVLMWGKLLACNEIVVIADKLAERLRLIDGQMKSCRTDRQQLLATLLHTPPKSFASPVEEVMN